MFITKMFITKARCEKEMADLRETVNSLRSKVDELTSNSDSLSKKIGQKKRPVFWWPLLPLYSSYFDPSPTVMEEIESIQDDLEMIKNYLGIERKTVSEKTSYCKIQNKKPTKKNQSH